MRLIPLRPDCLLAPTAHDVAVVGAMMLWPDNEAIRREAMTALEIQFALESRKYPQPTTQAEQRELIELIRWVPQLSDHAEAIKDGFRRGMIAGKLVHEAVVGSALYPGPVKLGPIKQRLARAFTNSRESIAENTINNTIWPEYRCVAPYWAAFLAMPPGHDERAIPCSPRKLGTFLAIADEFRRRGEATRLARRREHLLRAGETILIPPGIELPRGRLRFDPQPPT